jgi:hypothetical protein
MLRQDTGQIPQQPFLGQAVEVCICARQMEGVDLQLWLLHLRQHICSRLHLQTGVESSSTCERVDVNRHISAPGKYGGH